MSAALIHLLRAVERARHASPRTQLLMRKAIATAQARICMQRAAS